MSYPGAIHPERIRRVRSDGIGLSVYEWGDPNDPPLVLTHGGFDFGRTFEVFAPLLAAGGWRVVAWDQRGHGDSEHAAIYSWEADVRDAAAVIRSCGSLPLAAVGHSKGGGLLLQLAEAAPHLFSQLVNLDGLPGRSSSPDVVEHERTRQTLNEVAGWLDHRRRTHALIRKPGTVDELARRRARMNPRLPLDWLRHLVHLGAREEADGWRWKIDASMRFGGFGPWRPEWQLERIPGLGVPFLGVIGLEPEEMGWGANPNDVKPYLPGGASFHALSGVGHFVHIERPHEVAELVLDFLQRGSQRRGWR